MTKTPRELFTSLMKIKFSAFNPKPSVDAVTLLMLAVIQELEDLKERMQILEDREDLAPPTPRPDPGQ